MLKMLSKIENFLLEENLFEGSFAEFLGEKKWTFFFGGLGLVQKFQTATSGRYERSPSQLDIL